MGILRPRKEAGQKMVVGVLFSGAFRKKRCYEPESLENKKKVEK